MSLILGTTLLNTRLTQKFIYSKCLSNAVYTDDIETHQNTERFLFQLFGGPID